MLNNNSQKLIIGYVVYTIFHGYGTLYCIMKGRSTYVRQATLSLSGFVKFLSKWLRIFKQNFRHVL